MYAPAIYDDPADHEELICLQHESERHWWRHVIAGSQVDGETTLWQFGSGFFHNCYFNDLRRAAAERKVPRRRKSRGTRRTTRRSTR
jgi:hypothetical protein